MTNTGAGDIRPKFRGLFAVLDWITQSAYRLSALMLLTITLLYCMEIALRYFFLAPTIWTRDTVTYLLCATLMLAAPQVARNNSHVAILIFVEMAPRRGRITMERILSLIAGLTALGVAWITSQEVLRLFTSNILTLGTIAVPKWWIAVFIPVGFLLIGLQYLSFAADSSRLGHDRTQV